MSNYVSAEHIGKGATEEGLMQSIAGVGMPDGLKPTDIVDAVIQIIM